LPAKLLYVFVSSYTKQCKRKYYIIHYRLPAGKRERS